MNRKSLLLPLIYKTKRKQVIGLNLYPIPPTSTTRCPGKNNQATNKCIAYILSSGHLSLCLSRKHDIDTKVTQNKNLKQETTYELGALLKLISQTLLM